MQLPRIDVTGFYNRRSNIAFHALAQWYCHRFRRLLNGAEPRNAVPMPTTALAAKVWPKTNHRAGENDIGNGRQPRGRVIR